MFSSSLFSVSTTHYLCRERDSKGVITIPWSAIQRLHVSEADRWLNGVEGKAIRNHTGRTHVNCSLRAFLGRWHCILITLYHAQVSENTATLSPQVSYGTTPQNTLGTSPPQVRSACYRLLRWLRSEEMRTYNNNNNNNNNNNTSRNSLFLCFSVNDRGVAINVWP